MTQMFFGAGQVVQNKPGGIGAIANNLVMTGHVRFKLIKWSFQKNQM